jgi:large subunit ribosomal protein L31
VTSNIMKADIHPKTSETTITCTCGAVYNTISTVPNLRIGICSACHPYFTGEQRFIDTAGRVDKFAQRYGSVRARRTAPKLGAAEAAPAAAEA